jgi:WD40 repeat protein
VGTELKQAAVDDASGVKARGEDRSASATQERPPASSPEASSSPDAEALPITPRDRYTILGELARGGQGRILRAYDKHLRRGVVVKEALRSNPDAVARFVREAFITGRLEHPAIVPVHDAGRWPSGEPFYVMKCVSGRSLDEALAAEETLAGRLKLLPNVLAVAEAVAYAHSQRLIHRDLKPANVLVGSFSETVVVDWGLAKDLASDHPEPVELESFDERVSGKTAVGDIIGTPAYMPPEQAEGRAIDERADVYALGAMLYHVLAGIPPYSNRVGKARSVLSGPPDPVSVLQQGVPPDLSAVVDKAMARDPAARYAHAGELAEELKRFLGGRLVGAHRYGPWTLLGRWVRRNRLTVGVAAALVGAILVLGVVSVRRIVRERNAADAARGAAESAKAEVDRENLDLLLSQAKAELAGDPTASLALLKKYPASGPDWERVSEIAADAWSRGVARHLFRGERTFLSVALSRDARWVAAGSAENVVHLWERETGRARLLESDIPLGGPVLFSPDGTTVLSSDGESQVRAWDLTTGERRAIPIPIAYDLQMSADGAWLLGTDQRGAGAYLWDFRTGTGRTIDIHGSRPRAATLLGDGRSLAVVGGSLAVLDLPSGHMTILDDAVPHVVSIAGSSEGRWIAVGTTAKKVLLYDRTLGTRRVIDADKYIADQVRFAAKRPVLVACGRYDTGFLSIDAATGKTTKINPNDTCNGTALSADGSLLLTTRGDNQLAVSGVEGGGSRLLTGHGATIARVALSEDDRWAASASADHSVRVWRLGEGDVHLFRGVRPPAQLSRDGRTLLASSPEDHAVELLDLASGRRTTISPPRPWIWEWAGSFSPDSRFVAFAQPPELVLYDTAAGTRRVLFRSTVPNQLDLAEAFSPDGKMVGTVMTDGTVKIHQVDTGETRILGKHDAQALTVAFSPDSRRLATGGYDRVIRLWDLASGSARVLEGSGAAIWDVRFAPDNKSLASTGADGAVRIWSLDSGTARVFSGHTASVNSCAFSPDGTHLLTGSEDRTVRIWDLATGRSRVLRRDAGAVGGVSYSADGKTAVSFGSEAISMWDPNATRALDTDPGRLRSWIEATTSAQIDATGTLRTPTPE